MDLGTFTASAFVQVAQQAGYRVRLVEQPRNNRLLLTVDDPEGQALMIMIQARRLVTASDVAELADVVRIRRLHQGLLWAYGGEFSPFATQAVRELGDLIRLIRGLPSATTQPALRDAFNGSTSV